MNPSVNWIERHETISSHKRKSIISSGWASGKKRGYVTQEERGLDISFFSLSLQEICIQVVKCDQSKSSFLTITQKTQRNASLHNFQYFRHCPCNALLISQFKTHWLGTKNLKSTWNLLLLSEFLTFREETEILESFKKSPWGSLFLA